MSAVAALHRNLSLREATRLARSWGLIVVPRPGTDEIVFKFPGRNYVAKATKKDAGLKLVCWLRGYAKERGL